MSELTIDAPAKVRPARVSNVALLTAQALHSIKELVRSPVAAIVSLLLPIIFLLVKSLTAVTYHQGAEEVIHHLACTAAVFATVMASFVMLAYSVAIAKERGVLKRLRGTPLPALAYLGGKTVSSGAVSILGTGIMLAFASFVYGLHLPISTVLVAIPVLLAGIVCLATLGFAAAVLLSSAQAVLGATMGAFILVGFVSDLFFAGEHLPWALDTLGWLLPLRHFVAAFGHVLDPASAGSTIVAAHLVMLAAWTAGAALVVSRRFGHESRPTASRTGDASSSVSGIRWSLRYGGPSLPGMIWGQMRHANLSTWRAPMFAAFAVAFPVVFVAILPLVTGNPVIEGASFAEHMVVSMPVFAVALTAYVALADSLSAARDKGVLKRLRGTPVPPSAYVAGRIASVFWVAAITVAIVFAAGGLIHAVSIPLPSLPAVAVVIFIGTTTFAMLGFAVAALARDSGSVSAITLATLLPLKFVSDVFPVGGALPPFVNAIGWVFPLKHMVHAMRTALDSGELAFWHLSVVTLWALVGMVVAMLRFRFEP